MGKRADERSGATLDWLQLFFSANGGQRGGRVQDRRGETGRVEDRKRARLNNEKERERGKEKRREWIDSSTSMIPVKSLTDGNF